MNHLVIHHADVDSLPALGLDDYDDSVEPALAPCPFGVERGEGNKGTLVSVFRWDLRVKG